MSVSLTIGSKYNFTLYGTINSVKSFTGTITQIISGSYLPATCSAEANHTNIYPLLTDTLQATVSDDYTSYNYAVLRTDSGTSYYIGLPWIIESSVEEVTLTTCTIVLSDFDTDKKETLYKIIAQAGHTIDSMTVE